jgi:hypothetical protein
MAVKRPCSKVSAEEAPVPRHRARPLRGERGALFRPNPARASRGRAGGDGQVARLPNP